MGCISLAASYLSPHLGNCHYSEYSTPHFGWLLLRTMASHFCGLIALSIKALSTCPRFVPLVCADPHGSQTSLTEIDIEPMPCVCNQFRPRHRNSSTLVSSNNNAANPTFLACHALIARLLLRGNRSSPGAPSTTSIMHGLAGSS